MKRLTFLQLNELNFDILQRYIESGESFPGFEALLKIGIKHTSSEERYEELEPWIQWPSAYTGLRYCEHGLFRLGEGSSSNIPNIFEHLSERGISVSAVSPMNVAFKGGKVDVFVPDPWTESLTDGSWQSRFVHSAIRRLVNENASGRLNKSALAMLGVVIIATMSPVKILALLRLAIRARGSRALKAMFFDRLLYEIASSRAKKLNVGLHSVFLNGVAHVQHHFFNDCKVADVQSGNPAWYRDKVPDPILVSYKAYDEIVLDALSREGSLLVVTGLSQTFYSEPLYYYRLKNPGDFISMLNLPFRRVLPRMSRDFLVEFYDAGQANRCYDIFSRLTLRGVNLFGEMALEGSELFVSLTFGGEIRSSDFLDVPFDWVDVGSLVDFVALKNGHHVSKGYLLSDNRMLFNSFSDRGHVADVSKLISGFFAGEG